ncbi:MAG: NFACT family protein [Spirochaetales bacterium]|jgi:predicted ribosome quality control (RQC) complex YloA/Tae2 family protein|nr:NFACT family protein [Spirochaetales bacterium]
MSLNWKEIEKILGELRLEGRRVQDIRQPDFHSLVLELFQPADAFSLYISLAAGSSRIHRLSRKLVYPKVTQRFAEFLRSRIRGGRILEVRQVPSDRVLFFRIHRAGEETVLWLRLWGAASNIIAADEKGIILDAYYRRPGRGEETGGVYRPPVPAGVEAAGENAAAVKPAKHFEIRPWPAGMPFGAFIEEEYFRREEEALREKLITRLENRFQVQEAKISSTIAGLEKRLENYADLESMKKSGDLIMQNLQALKKGDAWCRAHDYETGADVEIALDAALSPHENAEVFYRKYKKAKSGRSIVEEELRSLHRQLPDLRRRLEELRTEKDAGVLREALREEKSPREKEKTVTPGLSFSSCGLRILVGRTAAENDELLRRYVRGNDYWLHTRDAPGPYVFVKCLPGKSVPLDTLLDAGNLAVFYSKARSSGGAELYYTQVKYLRRAKGEKAGTVLPTHEKNLTIRLDPARLEKLRGSSGR